MRKGALVRRLPRFRAAEAALSELAAREAWPRERIEEYQLARLNAVWAHAAESVPWYRDLKAAHGLPPAFGSLEEYRALVPVLPKSAVRANPRAFLSDRAGPGAWAHTSGSTGARTPFWWTFEARKEVLRAKYRFLQSWDVDLFDRTVFVMRPIVERISLKGRVREKIQLVVTDRLRNRRWMWTPRLGPGDLEALLARIAAFDPTWMYGYSRTIRMLARAAAEGAPRPRSLRLAVLTSETAPPRLVADVESGLGARVAIEYGATECGLVAAGQPDGTLRVREDVVFVETEPRDDGRHDVLLSVLVNPSFPLLRYAIDDVVDRAVERPARGFATLGRVTGRDDDFLVTATGRLLDSAALEDVLERPGVHRWRVRQDREGAVAVAIERTGPTAVDEAGIGRRIGELLEGRPVEVRVVDRLPAGESAKQRVVVSDLARPAAAVRA